MGKYITFFVPIKKEGDNGKNIAYKLRFIDSFRSCQLFYWNLMIICLEFLTALSVNHA